MPSAVRQGAMAVAVAELMLRLGEIGGRSALGERLGRALLRRVAEGEEEEEAEAAAEEEALAPLTTPAEAAVVAEAAAVMADALMVWPGGRALPLHTVLLAVRAPAWLRLLLAASMRGDLHCARHASDACVHQSQSSNDRESIRWLG